MRVRKRKAVDNIYLCIWLEFLKVKLNKNKIMKETFINCRIIELLNKNSIKEILQNLISVELKISLIELKVVNYNKKIK